MNEAAGRRFTSGCADYAGSLSEQASFAVDKRGSAREPPRPSVLEE
jgi:hypothetical protein